MAERRPLVIIDGAQQELPAGDSLPGAGGTTDIAAEITAATSKATPVDADALAITDSAASNVLKKLTWANLKAGIWSEFGSLISGGTIATTLAEADRFVVSQSGTKSLTWALLKANFLGDFGDLIINGAAKTTPADTDELPIVDVAASNSMRGLTWANVKATLKTYFDSLYVAKADAGAVLQTVFVSDAGSSAITSLSSTNNTTGTPASITPKSTSSKLKVSVNFYGYNGASSSGQQYLNVQIYEGSTARGSQASIGIFASSSGGITNTQVVGPWTLEAIVDNTALTTRNFELHGWHGVAISSTSGACAGQQWTITEVKS